MADKEKQNNIVQEYNVAKVSVGTINNFPGIYKITNIKNNKCYIGSTLKTRRRLLDHINLISKNKHHSYKLQGSVNKHGIDNFEFNVLEYVHFPENYNKEIKEEYLECLEEFYINKYNSYKTGYNVSEKPRRIGNSNTKNSIRKGIETRRKNGTFIFTDEHKQKISESLRNSDSLKLARNRLSKERRKKIYQYDLDGNFIREWDYINDASKELNIYRSMIFKTLHNQRTRCKQFIFSYNKADKIESHQQRVTEIINIIPPKKYVDVYKDEKLFHRFSDCVECANYFKIKKERIREAARENKSIKGYIIQYGEYHK